MRRLAILFMTIGVVLGFVDVAHAASTTGPPIPVSTQVGATGLAPVDVLQVSGLLDSILVDEITQAITRAEHNGAQALVLQLNSKGSLVGRAAMALLYQRIESATVPIAIWVGPSGSRATGLVAQLLSAADASGMAPGTRLGKMGKPLFDSVDFGEASETLRTRTMGFQEARRSGALKLEISDEGAPTIRNMVYALDGLIIDGVTLDTATENLSSDGTAANDITTVRFHKLGLWPQLLHTSASPPVAYLFLLIGLALMIFEFFTAGIGVAGVVGATLLMLAFYGLGELPYRGWALGLIFFSMFAFAVDVQVGVPRLWTGIGLVVFALGSWFLFPEFDQQNLQVSWLSLLVGIGGIALTFISGMPSMTRTRFATPTVGRERLIGQWGIAATDISPDGAILIGEAKWKARTNRATPLKQGESARVVAIDGVVLQVEPEIGAARDYRERRPKVDEVAPANDVI